VSEQTEGPERWHGTWGGYTNNKCRGPRCREAHRLGMSKWRARRREQARLRAAHETRLRYG
jgi:hypothetical protein